MKIPRRVDASVCAALANRPLANGVSRRSLYTVKDAARNDSRKNRPGSNFFCAKTSSWLLSTFAPEPPRAAAPLQRHVANGYSTAAAAAPKDPQDPAHLMAFVRQEDASSVEEHLDYYRDPYRRGYAQPDMQKLQVSDRMDHSRYPSKDELPGMTDETKLKVSKLCAAIVRRYRYPTRVRLEPIYDMYKQLPEPRMLHLEWYWKDRLLKIMGTPKKRNPESMLRYFALVRDTKDAGLTIRRAHWNLALAFATKYATYNTSDELETALRLWKEMERGAGIPGNDVTFNVLFDIAIKVGNFTLGDMIYQEMEARNIPFNRYHHVTMIHYFGLKMDSSGIRSAYRAMVEAGEMIDTVALNCVISGLLRCGEEPAAEETYQRMKNGHELAVNMPDRNYMTDRVVSKVLMMFAKVGKHDSEFRSKLQGNVSLTPDLRTYRLFIEHYSLRVGDLTKVAQYLDEMKYLKVRIHPTIFLALFKGFYLHGGFSTSEWSERRLEGVLKALYQAKDEGGQGFPLDRWVVIWALRAIKKCSTNEAVVEAFDYMSDRWDVPADRWAFMEDLLEVILAGKDMRSSRGNFTGPMHRRFKKNGGPL